MIGLVTDRRRLSAGTDAADRLVDLVSAAAAAGVDLIQIRERDLETAHLAELTRRCVAAVRGSATRVLVNDRVDVALAAGAHGVHLRGDSLAAPRVRQVMPRAVIGRSVHGSPEAAAQEAAGGLDYLLFGTVFQTASKPDARSVGVDALAAVCSRVHLPVLAIGGVTPATAGMVRRAGAAGVAGIGLFVPPAGVPPDRHLRDVVAALRLAFDTHAGGFLT